MNMIGPPREKDYFGKQVEVSAVTSTTVTVLVLLAEGSIEVTVTWHHDLRADADQVWPHCAHTVQRSVGQQGRLFFEKSLLNMYEIPIDPLDEKWPGTASMP